MIDWYYGTVVLIKLYAPPIPSLLCLPRRHLNSSIIPCMGGFWGNDEIILEDFLRFLTILEDLDWCRTVWYCTIRCERCISRDSFRFCIDIWNLGYSITNIFLHSILFILFPRPISFLATSMLQISSVHSFPSPPSPSLSFNFNPLPRICKRWPHTCLHTESREKHQCTYWTWRFPSQ